MQEGGNRRDGRRSMVLRIVAVVAICASLVGAVGFQPDVSAEPGVTEVPLEISFSNYPHGGSATYRVTRTRFGTGAVETVDVTLSDGDSTTLTLIEGDQVSVSRLGDPSPFNLYGYCYTDVDFVDVGESFVLPASGGVCELYEDAPYVRIVKDTNPPGGGPYAFTVSGAGVSASFSMGDNGQREFTLNGSSGTLTISEVTDASANVTCNVSFDGEVSDPVAVSIIESGTGKFVISIPIDGSASWYYCRFVNDETVAPTTTTTTTSTTTTTVPTTTTTVPTTTTTVPTTTTTVPTTTTTVPTTTTTVPTTTTTTTVPTTTTTVPPTTTTVPTTTTTTVPTTTTTVPTTTTTVPPTTTTVPTTTTTVPTTTTTGTTSTTVPAATTTTTAAPTTTTTSTAAPTTTTTAAPTTTTTAAPTTTTTAAPTTSTTAAPTTSTTAAPTTTTTAAPTTTTTAAPRPTTTRPDEPLEVLSEDTTPAPTTTSTTAPTTTSTTTTVPTTEAPEPDELVSLDDAMIPRGAPVSIDAECDRPFTARAGAVDLPIVDGVLDTVALGVGDHVVEVACDGTPVLEVDISVVEPVAGQSSAPATATTLLLFTCVGGFVVMGSPGSVAGDIRFRRSGVNKGGK